MKSGWRAWHWLYCLWQTVWCVLSFTCSPHNVFCTLFLFMLSIKILFLLNDLASHLKKGKRSSTTGHTQASCSHINKLLPGKRQTCNWSERVVLPTFSENIAGNMQEWKSLCTTGYSRNNSHIEKGDWKKMARGITKSFLFPKCR